MSTLRSDLAVCGAAEPLFLVSTAWTKSFFTSKPDTKICNASLVDLTQGCHKCRQVVLRQGLEEGKDFEVVDAAKWEKLCTDYGADYEICRFRVAARPAFASGSAVKSESTKATGKKKAQKKTAPAAPTTAAETQHKATSGKLPLELFPEYVAVYLQEDAKADAISCTHSVCGHPVRVLSGHNASVDVLGQLARQAITTNMDLDLATHEWLLPSSHRGYRFDYLYYDRKLKLWTPSRSLNGRAALPQDASRVISPDQAELKLCVCKRLKNDELVKHKEAANEASERLRKSEKRVKRKESDAAATTTNVMREWPSG